MYGNNIVACCVCAGFACFLTLDGKFIKITAEELIGDVSLDDRVQFIG